MISLIIAKSVLASPFSFVDIKGVACMQLRVVNLHATTTGRMVLSTDCVDDFIAVEGVGGMLCGGEGTEDDAGGQDARLMGVKEMLKYLTNREIAEIQASVKSSISFS